MSHRAISGAMRKKMRNLEPWRIFQRTGGIRLGSTRVIRALREAIAKSPWTAETESAEQRSTKSIALLKGGR